VSVAFKYSSVVGGLIDMILSAFLCTCGFLLIGYCCSKTKATTFRSLIVMSIGKKAGVLMDVLIFFHTLFSCVGYVTLIGDFTTKSMGGLFPGCIFATSRMASILTITVFVLFPLSLLRNLSSLKFTSALGLAVTGVACTYVFVDCLVNAEEYNAWQNLTDNWWSVNFDTFKAIALFNGSFSAHYNAPTYYAELQEKTFQTFAKASIYSFAIATMLFTSFGICGYARFGNDIMGNILKGYSADSVMVQVCWLCMMMSTVFVFPLSFQRMRSSWTALVNKPHGIHASSAIPWTTIALLAVSVFFGVAFDDISVIKMIKGATLGVSIMFIMPGYAYLCLVHKGTPDWEAADITSSPTLKPNQSIVLFSKVIIVVGVLQGTFALLSHCKLI